MKKSVIAVLLAMLLVFSLSACGGSDDSGSGDTVVYKVGTEPTFPPFDTTDDNQDVYKRQSLS